MAQLQGDAGSSTPLFPNLKSGVFGQSDTGYGVAGTSNQGNGVQGGSISGFGAVGTSGNSTGVVAISNNENGIFAKGGLNAGLFDGNVLIVGQVGIGTTNPLPQSKLDVNSVGTDTAVNGYSPNGFGIGGSSGTQSGVGGYSTTKDWAAVSGLNPNGTGVSGGGEISGLMGSSTLGSGVVAKVFGDQAAMVGISGDNNLNGLGSGVYGSSIRGAGVVGASRDSVGVEGSSSNDWCASFHSLGPNSRGVYVSVPAGQAGLQVASGTKSGVVITSQGARALYTEEATGVWFADYGFGQLDSGRATVKIDPLFAETANLNEPYHVFVQLNSADAEGVAVIRKTASDFQVHELRNGRSKAEFSYRVVAKRRGYEANRLDRASWADDDPNLSPAKRDAWEAEHQPRYLERLSSAIDRIAETTSELKAIRLRRDE